MRLHLLLGNGIPRFEESQAREVFAEEEGAQILGDTGEQLLRETLKRHCGGQV